MNDRLERFYLQILGGGGGFCFSSSFRPLRFYASLVISKRLEEVSDSPTLALNARVKEMQASGKEILNLTAGELDVDTEDQIKNGAILALKEGKTRYVPVSGIPELRSAIARKVSATLSSSFLTEEVMVTVGAKQACYQAMATLCDVGDEVVVPVPFWVSYPEMATLLGVRVIEVKTIMERDWKMRAEDFEKVITPKTKMLILNSPNNPTGALYSERELREIYEVAVKRNVAVLFDAIYEDFVYFGNTFAHPFSFGEEARKATVWVSGFSKAWAMTGWRLGYAIASSKLIKAMSKMQAHSTANATSFAQYGALEAFTHGVDFPLQMREKYERRLSLVLEKMKEVERIKFSVPEGAFYLWFDISSFGMSSSVFCEKLLEEKKVALVPGICFGEDKSVRLSYCVNEEVLFKALERLSQFVKTLKFV